MRQRMMTAAIALAMVVGLFGFGASVSLPGVSPQDASAANSDGCLNGLYWTVQNGGDGKLWYKGGTSCTKWTAYKVTIYVCGGINGQGYCAQGKSKQCTGTECWLDWQSCTIRYSGAYWLYTGMKIEDITLYGTWGDARWHFGPGQYVQGSC